RATEDGAGFARKPVEHVREDRAALATAGWIEAARQAAAGERRWSPPALGQGDRRETVRERVSKELGRRAISRAAGGHGWRKQRGQAASLAARVGECIRIVYPLLQLARSVGAVLLERGDPPIARGDKRLQRRRGRCVGGREAPALCGVTPARLIQRMSRVRGGVICAGQSGSRRRALVSPAPVQCTQGIAFGGVMTTQGVQRVPL